MEGALDSRSEGLEFDSQCWSGVKVSDKLLIHTALAHPAEVGT